MLGWGNVCGIKAFAPTEVMIKGLPPPSEANPSKFQRFHQEQAAGVSSTEPFFDIVDIAAGAKHFAMVTSEGNMILVGSNRYGQTGQPLGGQNTEEAMPYYYDMQFGGTSYGSEAPNAVACGCNFNIVYRRGGANALCIGNNHVGQLGIGHKDVVDNRASFAGWGPDAPWLCDEQRQIDDDIQQGRVEPLDDDGRPRKAEVSKIACGHNHTLILMKSGRVFACGSNTWGELGIGTTVSPMQPTRVRYFEERGVTLKDVAAGNSFSLFLSHEGKVYGCGATNYGQLPPNVFEPTAVPLVRIEAGKSMTNKLMRITAVACMGDAAVYVTNKHEVLFQGSIPDLGVAALCPKYIKLLPPAKYLTPDGQLINGQPPKVAEITGQCSTVVVRYEDGTLAAVGSNFDHQITASGVQRSGTAGAMSGVVAKETTARLAPFSFTTQLQELDLPFMGSSTTKVNVKFAATASGFLMLDHGECYGHKGRLLAETPIELPPGTPGKPGGDGGSAAPNPPRRRKIQF